MFVRLAGHSLAANESGIFGHSTVLGRRLANPEAIGLLGPLPSRCGPRIFSEPFIMFLPFFWRFGRRSCQEGLVGGSTGLARNGLVGGLVGQPGHNLDLSDATAIRFRSSR